MEALHQNVLSHFQIDAEAVSCERYGCGHINETYLVVTTTGHRYILQKINNHVFKDVPGLMANIDGVTKHLLKVVGDPRRVLTLVPTTDGASYLHHEEGGYWRVYEFIEDSICLQAPETVDDFYQSAVAFGEFQQQLNDYPAATLTETIVNFHNTVDRYRIFKEVLAKDPVGRAKEVQEEIAFALAHEEVGSTLMGLLQSGKLPLRVTHNDTKLNNVMLDAATRKPLAVIDLDTTMPGLSAYDFGDSIRFGAATAAEDEKDLSKVEMDLDRFAIYAKGYLSACPGLTDLERKMMPMGSLTMTLECGVRFLTDYIDGDHYFGIHYPTQNLDRCRTQFKLVSDMEKKFAQMEQIIADLSK